jgi:pilus assembly protein FimV
MQHLLRLCLWQAIIIGILTANFPVHAEEERGIRMRGPKSSDVFPYDKYGPITSQDTLWNIATRIRPDKRLSVYQVMQALYQENPQAFVDSNINYLVEGQYLKIPSFNNMMAINTNSARKKSENDSKAWKKAQPKSIKKEVFVEPSVKKKDLETVKTEINDQLQKIDGQQQERLELIQNDISDSIDGLQAILKENDDLRQRLSSFNDKLGVMQEEVAKGKEIKLQMDDMIKLQQALLAKAEAREQELLLEKELAALAEQDITSSLWFKIVMGTLPASLMLGLLWFLFKRRKQASDEVFFNELESKKQAPAAKKESPAEELSLDDELNLDDELDLSLDDELNLDDELDLSLDDELNLDDELDLSLDDELNLDDDLSIDLIVSDDDVIHLDEDDALDELEDILLDDDSDVDILDGGELGQDDLDSLLSGLDDDVEKSEESENEALEAGELSQEDLNDLLGGLDDSLDEGLVVEESNEVTDEAAEVTEPDDIDALLNSVNDSTDDNAEVTDPDDIDALLNSVSDPVSDSATDSADVTDPNDIDALLDSMNDSASEPVTDSTGDNVEVTDPGDIDALLDSVNDTAEVTDPDDIDALLDSMNDTAEVTEPDDIDSLLDSESETAEVTDPDDIDALLASMSAGAPAVQQAIKQDSAEVVNESETDSALSPEDLKIQNEKAENEAKISAFTAEYVTPFLTADFTDIMAQDSANEVADETLTNTVSDELDDELDIDALIADTMSKDEVDKSFNEDEKDDVGDDLINSPVDETIKTQVDGGFTEAEISQLLADDSLDDGSNQAEGISDDAIELSPDFTDEDVLAELLADVDDSDEEKLEEVNELDAIEELANVDFDELLANIEEESATTPIESDDIDLTYGGLGDEVGDDLLDDSFIEESIQSAQDVEKSENYLSVDDLISNSLVESDVSEPYEKTNIDVGLGQFAQNDSGIDVDKDGSMSSKLDLAKMYIEMNDEENAQVILQEVISKGDATQQVEAQALLDSL